MFFRIKKNKRSKKRVILSSPLPKWMDARDRTPRPCNSRPRNCVGTPLGGSARRWLVRLQPWVGTEGLVSAANGRPFRQPCSRSPANWLLKSEIVYISTVGGGKRK
ncbi:hypothetical protein CDAR_386341 [Caerostris darwini]|uniref:Uncharacterized protein n=1 Tax=Caerostris darwini TaxID=1538125 RepID=A0AAV4QHH4_9ARAC|nr:hypothetical protein CDAR_386341 [Caerostris darwini]